MNTTLQVDCTVLMFILSVLELVEKQLKSYVDEDELEIEGILMYSVEVYTIDRMIEPAQIMWDMV